MSTPSRRYLSVWLRRLPTDRIARRFGAEASLAHVLVGEPVPTSPEHALVVVAPHKSALRLSAVNDAAAKLGLKVGMPLADARAMHPRIAAADADARADAALLEAVADWCDRYTPLVGLDPPDGLLLDISGCAHLFGGEAALAGDLVQRLEQRGLAAQVAVAGTVGCAWGVARYREADRVGVPSGDERAALAPLPLAALRLSSGTIAALAQVGLKHITDVLDRPRAPLAARFGQDFVRRLDQALGIEDEPITPRLPVPAALVEQRFPEPIAHESAVLGTIERLAGRLGPVLEQRGEGARLLQVALFRADGKVFRIEAGTGAPLRDAARIARLFAERLAVVGDEFDPGFGFDMVRLSALVTERHDPQQTGLAAEDHATDLAHLIDRLGARFGLRRVTRLVPQDTHIPEFAVMAVGAAGARRLPHAPLIPAKAGTQFFSKALDSRFRGNERNNMELSFAPDHDAPFPTRPIRLFARPEPIDAIAEVPDGPPAQFTWRRMRHSVLHVEGPERIAMEWWRDEAGNTLMRDYFRVESREGLRVWLFRAWLNTEEERPTRWFIHGVFA
jgi:protein ImuB